MRGTGDAQTFSNISATTAAFTLEGGVYTMGVTATFGGGNVDFEGLLPDGTTWASHLGSAFTAAGWKDAQYLPAGQYRFKVTTATAVFATIARVPTD